MKSILLITVAFIFCAICVAQAQPYDSTQVYKPMDPWNSSDWVLTVTPYGWFPGVHGNATLNGFKSDVDVSFNEVWDHLDFGAMGRVEAWKSDWSFFVDSFYTKLSADYTLSVPPLSAKFDLDEVLTMTDLGVSYKLIDTQFGDNQHIIITPYGGGRYSYLKQEVKVSPNGPFAPLIGRRTIGGSEDWVEPFVGGRIIWKITNKFFAAFRGDAGGFGIGSASELTWNLLGWVGYAFNEHISLEAGYRILDVDYSTGSGRNKQGINAQLRGPIAGVTIRF